VSTSSDRSDGDPDTDSDGDGYERLAGAALREGKGKSEGVQPLAEFLFIHYVSNLF
jgi:hypothetical protein